MSSLALSNKIAIPYADALIEMAKSDDILKKITDDLSLILESLSDSDNLKNFLDNPLVKAKIKKNTLRKLYTEQINNKVLNFLYILVDRRRISLLEDIIRCYFNKADNLREIIVVNIVSSVTLTNSQQEALKEKLKKLTDSAHIKLSVDINPELIGGFIIKIGSKVIDNSLYGQLNQITTHLNAITL